MFDPRRPVGRVGTAAILLSLAVLLSPLATGSHAGTSGASGNALRPISTWHAPAVAMTFEGSTHAAPLLGISSLSGGGRPAGPSTAVQGPSPSVSGVTVGTHFPGVSSTNSSCGCAPPDVQVAVGSAHVVEMVNLEGKIWTKAGAVVSSFTLASFFHTGTDFISDPKVLYDNLSGRWFASILDVTNGTIPVAVSLNGSPAGSWYLYVVTGSPAGDFPDQPILGVSSTLVAIGGNQYVGATSAFVGGELWALNKSTMLTGSTTYFTVFGPHASWFSMHPVHSIGVTSKEYVVMTSGTSTIKLFNLTGLPSLTTSAHLSGATSLAVSAFSVPPSAPQKGTTKTVDTSDTRMQDAVWRANVLWLTFDTGCTPSGDASTRSCVRLTELSTLGAPSVVQDFNLAKSHTYLFYGALALDGALNVVIAYGYSNGTVFPAFAVTAHLAGGAIGSLLPRLTLVKGTAATGTACTRSVCRWGDYYGAGADPRSPNVWIAGEFVTTTTSWSTWISQVRA